jgi:hypothetical protein
MYYEGDGPGESKGDGGEQFEIERMRSPDFFLFI